MSTLQLSAVYVPDAAWAVSGIPRTPDFGIVAFHSTWIE
jgi:hypothetical protein